MASALEVMQEFNRAVRLEMGTKVPIMVERYEDIKLGPLHLDEAYNDRKGCLVIYWTDSTPMVVRACCGGRQMRTCIIDCYGSDLEIANVLAKEAWDALILKANPRWFRIDTVSDSIITPDTGVQADAVRLNIIVSHAN